MKIKEIRELSDTELASKRRDMKHEILNLRVQQKSGQIENTGRIKNLRRSIARIETFLTQKHQAAAVK
ncbi:MAG: 50S ribosomal protein L29 [Verrucomicrobiales bacterium]|nr:50S ribosomal protein L29 [Verrucomicrobiales bacterium]